MEIYRINKDVYLKMIRKRFRIIIPLVLLIILVGFGANLYTARNGEFAFMAVFFVLFTGFIGFSLYRSTRKQMQQVLSYTLTLSDNEITREQDSTPTITINFMEVKEIIKTKKGGFVIKGRTARDIIHVPHLIDNAGELEQRLQGFAPIATTGSTLSLEAYQSLIYLLGLAGFITSLTVNNDIIAILAGAVAIAVLIGLFTIVRRSKNANTSMRRRSWSYLLFALLIAYTLYTKIEHALPIPHLSSGQPAH